MKEREQLIVSQQSWDEEPTKSRETEESDMVSQTNLQTTLSLKVIDWIEWSPFPQSPVKHGAEKEEISLVNTKNIPSKTEPRVRKEIKVFYALTIVLSAVLDRALQLADEF